MKRATGQAPSEIADRNLETSIDSLASVGMLATEAERFRSGEDTGTKEVAECRSQARNGSAIARGCAPVSRDERERSKARDEGDRAPSPRAGSVGHGGFEDSSLNP